MRTEQGGRSTLVLESQIRGLPCIKTVTRRRVFDFWRRSRFGQESCSAANSLKLIPPAEVGKGEGKEEIFSGLLDTSDTLTPQTPGGRGDSVGGGRERESATTLAAPGV